MSALRGLVLLHPPPPPAFLLSRTQDIVIKLTISEETFPEAHSYKF